MATPIIIQIQVSIDKWMACCIFLYGCKKKCPWKPQVNILHCFPLIVDKKWLSCGSVHLSLYTWCDNVEWHWFFPGVTLSYSWLYVCQTHILVLIVLILNYLNLQLWEGLWSNSSDSSSEDESTLPSSVHSQLLGRCLTDVLLLKW